MEYRGRAQCIVIRKDKILMVKHRHGREEWYCLPGGGIDNGETPEQAAIRELQEECLVSGKIIKKTSEFVDTFEIHTLFYTFQIDIEDQIPMLGEDPEIKDNPILVEVRWMSLSEICERDRAYLWAAGLFSIAQFANELSSWSNDISYPGKRTGGSK